MNIFLSPAAVAATVTSLLLIALDVFIMLPYTLWAKRPLPRWTRFLPALAFVMMVAQIAANMAFNFAFVIMSVPIYLATLVIVFSAIVAGSVWVVRRALKRSRPESLPRLSLPKVALSVVCAALLLLGGVRLAQTYAYAGSIASRIALLEGAPGGADFSDRSWSQAFAGLTETLKAKYPFTAWKRIDWDARYAEFAPRIADAEARHDTKAYYRALREFAWRIPDGHVGIEGDDQSLAVAEVGGSYGLTLLRLDDGRLVVSSLIADGPAAQAGIQIGAEIVAWNGATSERALARTPIIWSEYPPATTEGRLLQQVRFLSRGPVGAQAEVAFRNRGAAAQVARLTASAAELDQHGDMGPSGLVSSPVESQLLPSGYGYIRVNDEIPHLAGFPDDQMRQAVARFAAQGVPGVIVDVRDNLGGESKLTAAMLAPFLTEERLYQYLGLLDPATQQFRPATNAPLMIEPAQPQYHGRVVVLIDQYSHSAAEDIALFLKDLPNGTVVGMSGTVGAGGTSETDVQLPGGYTFAFPKAQSLDANFTIQIESDDTGNGGVVPDIRVPRDDAAVDALGAGRDIVLERAEAALRAQTAGTR
ncbi:MAG TPA: S41 family peptidase [Roseiflexaceae bacterium]|jgi:carboxyl-terminal processing protease